MLPGLINKDVSERYEEEIAVYLDPRVQALFDEKYRGIGVVHLQTTFNGSNSGIWSDKKVDSVEAFKGLKIRTAGVIATLSLKELGASPLTMTMAEVEQALIRGTVDAVLTSPDYGFARGLPAIVDYVSMSPITPTFEFAFVMNAEKYDSLPPELQEALERVSMRVMRMTAHGASAEYFFALQGIELAGAEKVEFSKAEWDRIGDIITKPVTDAWLKMSGPEAAELLGYVSEAVSSYSAYHNYPLK